MMKKKPKTSGHWTNESLEDFQSRISFDFVAQLEDRMADLPMKQKDLAEILGVSESAVSQKLNNPDNLELKTIIAYTRAVKAKVAVVLYEDEDPDNADGPVNAEIFTESWKRQGKPKSFLDLNPELLDEAPVVMPKGRVLPGRWTTNVQCYGTDSTEKSFKPLKKVA